MKLLAIIMILCLSTSAMADMYMECTPQPNVGTRHGASLLHFEQVSDWYMRDGKRRVYGTLRGNPEGRGFVVLSSDSHGTWVYKFFSARCDGEGAGTAKALLNNVLLNSYNCKCGVD